MVIIGTLTVPLAIILPLGSVRDSLAFERERILAAIQIVESGGLNRPSYPDGDHGLSIGPLQIGRLYWRDAVGYDRAIGGRYEDCRDVDYARRVVGAYMRRYAPAAWRNADAEVIARTHNGGPRGRAKRSTLCYWRKVRDVLLEFPPLAPERRCGRLSRERRFGIPDVN